MIILFLKRKKYDHIKIFIYGIVFTQCIHILVFDLKRF